MNRLSSLFLVSLFSGAVTLSAYKLLFEPNGYFSKNTNGLVPEASDFYGKRVGFSPENVDFTSSAEKTIHTVVHVKNVSRRTITNPIMEFFYGYGGSQQREQIGTGSGVIISEDGYIVTNNHVVKDANEIEITLNNKKSYKAKLIGTDSKMDIALLKINADEKLPYTAFANSDSVKVGEWVLAVGNPYNLTSTVTAGIVSAKARNLDTSGIQSFIQTDAAVNPGNSGGALVNTRGELIGINTMISSPTGSYTGYSFAVPSNIARKIIEDIMEYGNVQRGILGVEGGELNSKSSKELGISQTEGFYVNKVTKRSGAEKAGLQKGDVIIKLDNQ
jgi:S1-C subfamily serine protease